MLDSVLLMLADFHKRVNDQNQQQLILKQVIDTLKNELVPEGLDKSWNELDFGLVQRYALQFVGTAQQQRVEKFICALDLYGNCRIEHSQELQRGDLIEMDKLVARISHLFFAQLTADEEAYEANPQSQQAVQQMFRQVSKCVGLLNENFKGYIPDEYTHQLDERYKNLAAQLAKPAVGPEAFGLFAECAQTVLDAIAQIEQRDKFSPRIFDVMRETAQSVQNSAAAMREGKYVQEASAVQEYGLERYAHESDYAKDIVPYARNLVQMLACVVFSGYLAKEEQEESKQK